MSSRQVVTCDRCGRIAEDAWRERYSTIYMCPTGMLPPSGDYQKDLCQSCADTIKEDLCRIGSS